MQTFDPRWRKFIKNLGWYMATLIVLIALLRFVRSPFVLLALWAVGLVWGGVLAFRFSQLLFGGDEIAISEEQLQEYVDKALSYKAQIDSAIKTTANKTEQPRLEQLRSQINTWTKSIGDLAERLNSLRQDDVIRRDMREVPQAIADLETRLANESDTVVRSQLERTLDNRRKQLDSLEQLQTMMKRAEIQIESTLSQLGTIYSQLLTGQSTSHVADYSRLSADVDEEVRLLQDHLEALKEVKLG
jgi:predicted  nucleic acid-binding Zn-ribbon protein